MSLRPQEKMGPETWTAAGCGSQSDCRLPSFRPELAPGLRTLSSSGALHFSPATASLSPAVTITPSICMQASSAQCPASRWDLEQPEMRRVVL